MKFLAACAIAALAAGMAFAQEEGERARIRAERAAAEERFTTEEKACRARFAVVDCMDQARRGRNATLAHLRRQEMVLDEQGRRRRAADRQRDRDERNTPEREREAAEKRARAEQEQREREARVAEKQARRAASAPAAQPGVEARVRGVQPQGSPRPPQAAPPAGIDAVTAARNRRRYEERQQQAAAHRAAVQARIERRARPAASSLPVPP